jgi:hypothetical protein
MKYASRLPVLCAALLAGCALLSGREDPAWPAGLPERALFENVYRADPLNARLQTEDEYLGWVRRFYLGSDLYPYGFRDLESLVLGETPARDADRVGLKLRRLGRSIAADWAKHRDADHITTAILALWAGALQTAAPMGRSEALLDQIEADVRALLAGQLDPAAIASGRYGGEPDLAFNDSCLAGIPAC